MSYDLTDEGRKAVLKGINLPFMNSAILPMDVYTYQIDHVSKNE